jgi:hypothetical protein
MVAISVVVQLIFRSSGRHSTELRAQVLPGYGVGVNNGDTYSSVIILVGGICWETSCLVFVFPGENLSLVIGGAMAAASTSFHS